MNYDSYDSDVVKEKKVQLTRFFLETNIDIFFSVQIIDFELECLSALQRGCTSYTLTDDYFTYNYTLRLEESNVRNLVHWNNLLQDKWFLS